MQNFENDTKSFVSLKSFKDNAILLLRIAVCLTLDLIHPNPIEMNLKMDWDEFGWIEMNSDGLG